ncbi:acyl-CoA reductase-like NAD-dependent aldehyde dehydrogenase [Angulomicrobium tetraedrale]|uniref:Acyl-CoA reductase-like NAD-dependent aldehyde dehydrogenase n=1 Tax=Ancylobacter tetraedralis TaxID=217068 RepID=A0A839ZFD3_9HYPH|nr:aldehyde dehydrogenase family protein [Ancylobacter tetraedralis]MBB3773551.1 acyl-CoA reductase-like NAD-dependent aldehyde dehydrogenase [Ancylobacter tetraedralis]
MSEAMLIAGRLAGASDSFDVIDPATGEAFASAPDCSPAQLDEAIDAAARAFVPWSRDISRRRQVLLACAQKLRAHAEEVGRLICREQGRPLPKAIGEVMGAARWFEHTAGLELPVEVIRDDDAQHISVHRRPLGVVAGIAPWNYPVISAVWKIAPALLAGNAIVLKPSPFTPLSTLRLGALLQDVIPAGVLAIVSGGDALGRALAVHPAIRKISLTGSVEAGKSVARAAADDLKRVTLELGGNDAAIVLEDVDPEAIADKLFWGAFQNTGQVCCAIKRLYVHESVCQPIQQALLARIAATRVGNGLDEGVDLGPLTTAPQFARVQELAQEARAAGGVLLGEAALPNANGYFLAPQLVTGLDDDARLVAEEQFGPLLPILTFRDEAEVLERANATHFGLSGSVWSGNVARATELAGEMDCGTVWVNQHLTLLPIAPVGGHKWSGIGVENGSWGLVSYTDIQTISVAKA